MIVKIEKMDHLGNGIGYIDGKVVFVPFTITGDEVEINLSSEKKKYLIGSIEKIITPSKDRIDAFCPYYKSCGGCNLQNLSYSNIIKYKKDRVLNILNNIVDNIDIIENQNRKNYRNKIELKVNNKKIGFYSQKTHDIVEIDRCDITKNSINSFIKEAKKFNIINGDIIIKSNYNDELLISIYTKDDIMIDENILPKYKVVGIVLNNECIYGENFFLDKINDLFFEVSYNSFFQVNSYINSKLFNLVLDSINYDDTVLDLYSGVGTLSLVASKKAKRVVGVEIVKNAVLNALKNRKINNISNVDFLLQDLEKGINIDIVFDTVIVDPPRNGIDTKTMNYLMGLNAKKIIYISCDANTLQRDLNVLIDKYDVKKVTMLDMFSYTYHAECVSVLQRKSLEK